MNEDKMISKLIKHDERFDKIERKLNSFVTREEFNTVMDNVISKLDNIIAELAAVKHGLGRHETRIQRLESFH